MRPVLREKVTYWAPGTENQFGGRSYSMPVIIDARWEDKMENIVSPTGEQLVARSKVYAEQEMHPSGYVYRGEVSIINPTTVLGAEEIRVVGSSPDLQNLSRLWTAFII
jgi:hypothetical protein